MLGKVLSSISGAGVATAVGAVGNALDALITSDEERDAAELLKKKLEQEPNLAQIALNKMEAQHRSIFVAGWRPFIGWVCGAGIAWQFIIRDLLMWLTTIFGVELAAIPPALDAGPLMALVTALLGLGGLRTAEKFGNKTK